MDGEIGDDDYQTLARFRHELRQFLHFSAQAAHAVGLTPQQHQALLAIRAGQTEGLLVGELADHLLLKPHSASELADRLAAHGLVERVEDGGDRRQVQIRLTDRSRALLASLSNDHRAELRRLRPLLRTLLDAL